jgi:hypothetical protein
MRFDLHGTPRTGLAAVRGSRPTICGSVHARVYRPSVPAKRKLPPEEAWRFWVGLGPTRTYVAVATRFGVSDVAVSRHANRHGWKARLAEIERRGSEAADKAFVRDRVETIRVAERVAHQAALAYARRLADPRTRINARDFVAINRFYFELTEPPPATHHQELERAIDSLLSPRLPQEVRNRVVNTLLNNSFCADGSGITLDQMKSWTQGY